MLFLNNGWKLNCIADFNLYEDTLLEIPSSDMCQILNKQICEQDLSRLSQPNALLFEVHTTGTNSLGHLQRDKPTLWVLNKQHGLLGGNSTDSCLHEYFPSHEHPFYQNIAQRIYAAVAVIHNSV